MWKACPRIKKNAPPFPSLHRLIRHVKEVHILKSPGRVVPPTERSKYVLLCNFITSGISKLITYNIYVYFFQLIKEWVYSILVITLKIITF